MSQDLSFEHHIRTIANKGIKMAGWILRTFNTRRPNVLLTLLKQLIYPTIEYNSILWNPTDPDLIDLLESVQNNFLKRIECQTLKPSSDYWDRLATFKLYSLQRRRERYRIIYTWKIIHNFYPNPGHLTDAEFPDHTDYPNPGITIHISNSNEITVRCREDLPRWAAGKSVLKSCCDLYNSLPRALRRILGPNEYPILNTFKEGLDNWLVTIPDRPNSARRAKICQSNSILHQKEYKTR